MRLLNVHTLEFGEFHHEGIPPYIIASHRWGLDELEFKDLKKRRRTHCFGYTKVLKLCEIVRSSRTEVNWLWIDTVCIDKRDFTEVSETINSMFKWYQRAECCLAYLSDVRSPNAYLEKPGKVSWFEAFRRSAWFKRGWTLQELIAPRTVVFLSADWEVLGHKGSIKSLDPKYFHSRHDLTKLIRDASGIPEAVLYDGEERKACGLQEKMSWMAERATTRVEDAAYCLLGLFDVFMPPIYGEGDQAHMRLLKEILAKESEHQTRLEEDKMKKKMSELDMDRELAAEEQATEIAKYVSRLVRNGFSRDRAIQRLARKWQGKWNVSLEQATGDINQFLAVLEYRSAWAKEGMERLLAQGKAKATAVRYLEAELQKYGYSPVDAYKAVRGRLRFKPIVDSPGNATLGALHEETRSDRQTDEQSNSSRVKLGANKVDGELTNVGTVPRILVTEFREPKDSSPVLDTIKTSEILPFEDSSLLEDPVSVPTVHRATLPITDSSASDCSPTLKEKLPAPTGESPKTVPTNNAASDFSKENLSESVIRDDGATDVNTPSPVIQGPERDQDLPQGHASFSSGSAGSEQEAVLDTDEAVAEINAQSDSKIKVERVLSHRVNPP